MTHALAADRPGPAHARLLAALPPCQHREILRGGGAHRGKQSQPGLGKKKEDDSIFDNTLLTGSSYDNQDLLRTGREGRTV